MRMNFPRRNTRSIFLPASVDTFRGDPDTDGLCSTCTAAMVRPTMQRDNPRTTVSTSGSSGMLACYHEEKQAERYAAPPAAFVQRVMPRPLIWPLSGSEVVL